MSRVDVTLGVKNAPFKKGMEQAKGQVKSFRTVASRGFNFGQAAGMGALLIGLDRITEKYDRIHKLSKRFALDARDIQQLGFAAEQNGANMELMAKAMAQANRSGQEAGRGLKTYSDQFDALNIDVEKFNSLDQKEQFLVIADAVATATDRNKALAAAQQLMGRSAVELVPLMMQGSEAIREQAESISTLTNEQVAAMARTRDELNKANTDITGGVGIMLASVIIGFKVLVGWATIAVTKVYDAVTSTQGAIKNFIMGNFSAANESMKAMVRRMKTTKKEMVDVWDDAAAQDVESGGIPGGVTTEALAQQQQAKKLTEERLKLEQQISAEQEKQRDAVRTTAQKVKAADDAAQTAVGKMMEIENQIAEKGSTPALEKDLAKATLEYEKAMTRFKDLQRKQQEEQKKAAESERQQQRDDYQAQQEQMLEGLKERETALAAERDAALRSADAYGGGFDRLQSIGLGAAGVNYSANPEQTRQTKLAAEANKHLVEVRDAIEHQEITLQEDQF